MTTSQLTDRSRRWPELPFEAWKDTAATLHMWTQIVGKVRTVQTPWINHSWHVTLYVTPRGLTTSPIPYGDADLPDRLRLPRPPTAHSNLRRRVRALPLQAPDDRRVLRRR